MKTASLVRVRLGNQERRAQFTLSLLDRWEGGRLLRYPDDFSCRLRGADERAATYTLANWESGLMSGAFYAFRQLKEPRLRLLVSELEGCLRSDDMPALALAASIAVTELLGGDTTTLTMPGWTFQVAPAPGGPAFPPDLPSTDTAPQP